VIQTTEARSALDSFDTARDAYLKAFSEVPSDAMPYLKAGDDYSLGGLAVHVAFVIEHYTNVLDTMVSANFSECHAQDPDGLEDRALAKAKSNLTRKDVQAELNNTRRRHDALIRKVERLGQDWSRKAPVWFKGAAEVYPTGASDVLKWLTDHYEEHIPHMKALVADWQQHRGLASDPLAVVAQFNEAFARGDVDAVMALMTDDCIFENTFPAPDGERHVGAKAVRPFWNQFFANTEAPRFETEEIFAVDDRVVARWRFSWGTGKAAGHVRGADLFRIRDGKVAEKLSYVKG
jgi:ketosteroid isomerase-like protein